ncbi:hypothetical protein EBO15_23660 [Actinomadura harenae]|uniref:Uncharacterized protein n=1 Tax=Actinomadura harenae TaxID=2483351 RepID=A0A3M2M2F0_9ACTN|nr:hypothetical protein EBO15_23660 [Actinomadura harenae]
MRTTGTHRRRRASSSVTTIDAIAKYLVAGRSPICVTCAIRVVQPPWSRCAAIQSYTGRSIACCPKRNAMSRPKGHAITSVTPTTAVVIIANAPHGPSVRTSPSRASRSLRRTRPTGFAPLRTSVTVPARAGRARRTAPAARTTATTTAPQSRTGIRQR